MPERNPNPYMHDPGSGGITEVTLKNDTSQQKYLVVDYSHANKKHVETEPVYILNIISSGGEKKRINSTVVENIIETPNWIDSQINKDSW